MTSGRALLRNYVAIPEPAEVQRTRLPVMRGDRTLSAPARPDLWLMENTSPTEASIGVVEDGVTGPQALSMALLGASPVPQPLHRPRAHTLVPSALDAHSFTTLTQDDEWFGGADPAAVQTWEAEWALDDEALEAQTVQELPRVLGALVELGVFFAGLGIGLAVQGAFAFALWTALS